MERYQHSKGMEKKKLSKKAGRESVSKYGREEVQQGGKVVVTETCF
jgi:hypothetical protein